MLGHMVLDVLSDEPSLTVEGTHRLNPFDPLYLDAEAGSARLEETFRSRGEYQFVINCIGVTKNDIDEKDSSSVRRAIQINAYFPHYLADVARRNEANVIQISTDGVFEGTAERYFEDSPQDCTDVYGKTKSLGEVLNPSFLNIRCSIIGPDPNENKGLLEWFLSRPKYSEVRGYTNHFWNGVTTIQFAELCKKIIINSVFSDIVKESRVHHFCPNQPVSKYELLDIFKKAFKRDVQIVPSQGPGKRISRILDTSYTSLKRLFGDQISMVTAVEQLSDRLRANRVEL